VVDDVTENGVPRASNEKDNEGDDFLEETGGRHVPRGEWGIQLKTFEVMAQFSDLRFTKLYVRPLTMVQVCRDSYLLRFLFGLLSLPRLKLPPFFS
jgi:hypothetical protein